MMSVLVITPLMTTLLVSNAITARRRFFEAAIEEKLNGLAHGSAGASCDLDVELLEETDGAVTHAAAEDDIRLLLVDELGNHARLMAIRIRIGYGVNALDLVVFNVYKNVVGAAAKMMTGGAS
jgi:hypothetical protein